MTLSIRNYIFMITILLNCSFANSKNIQNESDLWSNDFLPPLIMTQYMGTKVGNGGISVVCDTKRYFLDYFYYQTKHNWTKKFKIFDELSHEEIINKLLITYSVVDKKFTEDLLYYSLGFLNDIQKNVILGVPQKKILFTEYLTGNIYDICGYDQIIFHNYNHGTHFYSVNLNAFYEMDKVNQVVAILHEALYFKINFNNKGFSKAELTWVLSEIILNILDAVDFNASDLKLDDISVIKNNHYDLIQKYSKYFKN